MRDGIFDKLKQHFSEEQIFELTFRIALCGFFNRVNDSLQISMEDGVVEDLESVDGISKAVARCPRYFFVERGFSSVSGANPKPSVLTLNAKP